MSARLKGRRREVDRLVGLTRAWAEHQPDLNTVLVVGSYAYGRPRMASDLDLVLISESRDQRLESLDFVRELTPTGQVTRRLDWGPMHECRVRLGSGLYVEFGVAWPQWLEVPVDAGTARVLSGGCRVVHDRGRAATALAELKLPVLEWSGAGQLG